MTTYDPESRSSRESLAVRLLAKLHVCGFSLEKRPNTNEAVYSRVVDGTEGKIRVMVYTSVVNGKVPLCRPSGKDAIRICAVYRSARTDKEHGIVSERRINRTGDLDKIVERAYTRMRSVYKAALSPVRCPTCGSPTFKSKAGNQVCADFCWKSDGDLARDNSKYNAQRGDRAPSRYRRRWRRSA